MSKFKMAYNPRNLIWPSNFGLNGILYQNWVRIRSPKTWKFKEIQPIHFGEDAHDRMPIWFLCRWRNRKKEHSICVSQVLTRVFCSNPIFCSFNFNCRDVGYCWTLVSVGPPPQAILVYLLTRQFLGDQVWGIEENNLSKDFTWNQFTFNWFSFLNLKEIYW